MSEVTKQKVLSIDTNKASKNVKSLKQVIKELREEMALLEQGTAEYDEMSKKLADAMQKQREIAEAAKYSNRDIGATLSNITTIGAGAVGAINGVSAALQLVGVSGEDAEEALKNIQLTMALIQGMSALDTALKAIKGLSVAFKGLNAQRISNTTTTLGAAGAETAEAAALVDNTKKTYDNIDAAKSYNEAQIQNTTNTEASTTALYKEAKGLETVAAARQGDMTKLEQYRAELAKLQEQQAALQKAGMDSVSRNVVEQYKEEIKRLKEAKKLESDTGIFKHSADYDKMIAEYEKYVKALETGTANATEVISHSWRSLSKQMEDALTLGLPVDKIEEQMKSVAQSMDTGQITERLKTLNEEGTRELEVMAGRFEKMGMSAQKQQVYIDAYTGSLERQKTILTQELTIQQQRLAREQELTTTINEENGAISRQNGLLKENTKAKQQNAGATGAAAGAEANLAKSTKTTIPLLTKLGNAIKNAGKGIMEFVKANPILLTIVASIGAVAGAMALIANATKKALKDVREMRETAAQLNNTFEDQTVRLNVLLNAAQDETQSLNERKKAVEELNKIVPNYNAQIDETTGEYTASATALQHYIDKLREKIELEAYEGKIKELLQARLDLEQKLIKAQTNGWNIFGIKVRKLQKQIKETDDQIEKLYGRIQDLYLPWALDENKVETGKGSGIVKTAQEIYNNIKAIFNDLWNTIFNKKELEKIWNGVYSEVDIAMLNLKRIIKTSDVGNMLSKEFQDAVNKGTLKDLPTYKIDMEFVFNQKEYDKFGKELGAANAKLEQMLAKPGKYSEKEIKAMQEQVNKLKDQQAAYKQIIESAYKVSEMNETLARAERERIALQKELNQQAMIEAEYRAKARYTTGGEKELAPIQKEIDINNLLIAQLDKKKEARDKELALYDEEAKKKKDVVERIKKLNEEQVADDKKRAEAQIKIDEAQYSKRIKELELFYVEIDKATETEGRLFDNEKILKGFGTADFNTEVEKLQQQLQSIQDKMLKTQEYYQQQVKDGMMSQLQADMEIQAALTNLEEEAAAKRIELAEAEVDRKIAAQEAYISAFQSISSQVSQLLSAEMANVDQNSKEYRRMAYMQGIVDTTSGTLAAYMSGVKSPIPAPGNVILGGILAALTFATGVAQLRNIKNNTLANSTVTTTPKVDFGSYDTLTYAQNADILSNIKDSKVYVLENEITSTQNRVQVRESNATF